MANHFEDASLEPGAIPAALPHGAQWFGHPRQLARLFSTEAMERFGYYGMRALLTLYLAQHFLFSDTTTTGIYGGFTALVYLTPLIGGLMADRFLGVTVGSAAHNGPNRKNRRMQRMTVCRTRFSGCHFIPDC